MATTGKVEKKVERKVGMKPMVKEIAGWAHKYFGEQGKHEEFNDIHNMFVNSEKLADHINKGDELLYYNLFTAFSLSRSGVDIDPERVKRIKKLLEESVLQEE
jgi:hypothetical protein